MPVLGIWILYLSQEWRIHLEMVHVAATFLLLTLTEVLPFWCLGKMLLKCLRCRRIICHAHHNSILLVLSFPSFSAVVFRVVM